MCSLLKHKIIIVFFLQAFFSFFRDFFECLKRKVSCGPKTIDDAIVAKHRNTQWKWGEKTGNGRSKEIKWNMRCLHDFQLKISAREWKIGRKTSNKIAHRTDKSSSNNIYTSYTFAIIYVSFSFCINSRLFDMREGSNESSCSAHSHYHNFLLHEMPYSWFFFSLEAWANFDVGKYETQKRVLCVWR